MLYPFFEDLSKISEEELIARIEKLRQRFLNFGRHNNAIGHQLQLMMDSIQSHLEIRQLDRQKKLDNEPINIE